MSIHGSLCTNTGMYHNFTKQKFCQRTHRQKDKMKTEYPTIKFVVVGERGEVKSRKLDILD